MRKYIIGFICGMALSLSTVVFAANSSTIQAYLYPSRVLIHIGSTVKELGGSNDTAIIKYNGKAYIPLRAFTEAMDSTLTFAPASSINGFLNKIDIYNGGPVVPINKGSKLTDSEGYVTLSELKVAPVENGTNHILKSGTIQINKDISGKTIEIHYKDELGVMHLLSEYIYILNEDIDKPTVGDIRSFQTYAGIGSRSLDSLYVVVHDTLKPYPQTDNAAASLLGNPIAISFGTPSNFSGTMSLGEISPFFIAVANTSSNNIIIQPYDLTFEVYKTDSDYKLKELVYSFKMPRSNGTLTNKSGYSVVIPWNQKGMDGKFITAGKYAVRLKAPASLQYFKEGSDDIITYPLYLRSSGFDVEFK